MPATAHPSVLRKILDEQFSLLATELVALYEQELTAREAENRQCVRDELAENLNQAVRLLRQAEDFKQMCAVLVDSSATYCNMVAVFSIDGDMVRAERTRGLPAQTSDQPGALEFPVAQAEAFAGAIQSGDPVVAMTTPREVSPALAAACLHKPEDRAYILPIQVREKAVAVVYASGSVEMAPLELLVQAAVLATEARRPPEAKKPELVMIQGGRPAERKVPESWTQLSPPDQEMHLRAQRFARVQVAGMRLFAPEMVRQGRASKDIYGALQKDIDAGREMFRQTFVATTPNMLDYFHLELLRTLANDDPQLLGEKYPGPLV